MIYRETNLFFYKILILIIMKKLLFALAIGMVFMVGLLSTNVKEAEAGLCGFDEYDVCCETGSECYCLS